MIKNNLKFMLEHIISVVGKNTAINVKSTPFGTVVVKTFWNDLTYNDL